MTAKCVDATTPRLYVV